MRHFYDLHFLLQSQAIQDFLSDVSQINGMTCFEFFAKTLKDEYEGTQELGFNNSWMDNSFSEAIIFKKLDDTWEELKKEYEVNFSQFVYGDLPTSDQIKETITQLKEIVISFDKWRVENDIKILPNVSIEERKLIIQDLMSMSQKDLLTLKGMLEKKYLKAPQWKGSCHQRKDSN